MRYTEAVDIPRGVPEFMWMDDIILPVEAVSWSTNTSESTFLGFVIQEKEQVHMSVLVPHYRDYVTFPEPRAYDKCEIFGVDRELVLYNPVVDNVTLFGGDGDHQIDIVADGIDSTHR